MKKVIGIGAVLVDEIFYCRQPAINGTSNPALMKKSAGGVIRNIMQHLALLGSNPAFITVVGNDSDGEWIKSSCTSAGVNMDAALNVDCETGKYTALINPDGSLQIAAAYNPSENYLNIELLEQKIEVLSSAYIIVADTNLSPVVLQWLIIFCNNKNIKLIIETVSVSKASKLTGLDMNGVFMITPNEDEINSICGNENNLDLSLGTLLKKGIQNIWLRLGEKGSAIYNSQKNIALHAPQIHITDTTGAGDAALAAWISMHVNGYDEITCLKAAHSLAAIVLQTSGAISPNLSMQALINSINNYYPGEE